MRVALCLLALGLVGAGCSSAETAKRATTAAKTQPPSKAYLAAVAYAKCMRRHGVPHPFPNRQGDFHLAYAQERRMKAVSTQKQRQSADAACFRYLRGTVSTKPLSPTAQRAALQPLRALRSCLASKGYEVGKPIVRILSRGRAMFGFERVRERIPAAVQHGCEREVGLAQKVDAIVRADRRRR